MVKPTFASTSVGVTLIEVRDGELFDLVKGSPLSRDSIFADLLEVERRFLKVNAPGHYLVEELLETPDGAYPPPDIRFYMFQGEVGFILVEDHISGHAEASCFDSSFKPMADVHKRFGVHEKVRHLESITHRSAPQSAEELIALAKRVSVAVPSAFARIDLYDTNRRPVLGEITLYPGTYYYKNRKLMSDCEARRLGLLWDRAEEKLKGTTTFPNAPFLG